MSDGCSTAFIANFSLVLLSSTAFTADFEKALISWVIEKR